MPQRPSDLELPDPQTQIGNLIRRAQQLHLALWGQIVSTEITSAQYSILVMLHRLGEASQRDLCHSVDLDRSTIADLVRRMELAGLITRRRALEDARRNVVTLTERGRSECVRLTPKVLEVQQELIGHLDEEEATALFSSLQRILKPAG